MKAVGFRQDNLGDLAHPICCDAWVLHEISGAHEQHHGQRLSLFLARHLADRGEHRVNLFLMSGHGQWVSVLRGASRIEHTWA